VHRRSAFGQFGHSSRNPPDFDDVAWARVKQRLIATSRPPCPQAVHSAVVRRASQSKIACTAPSQSAISGDSLFIADEVVSPVAARDDHAILFINSQDSE
jgi:hypothetical protein